MNDSEISHLSGEETSVKLTGFITDVPGILVGHATDRQARTGCTVVLCENDATGGIDIRGTAAGTRQVDALRSLHLVNRVQAILLSGGSAFGLDAAGGVMRFLEERGRGFDVKVTRVPIVPAAVIFDLAFAEKGVRPDREMGYQACLNAANAVEEGSVGVGTGATVGKLHGLVHATKGGVGTACMAMGGVLVGALVVVNAFGDVFDEETGKILAGSRDPEDPLRFVDTFARIKAGSVPRGESLFNTTLGIVATNVKLSRPQAGKLAQMAQNGLVKVIRPIHSTYDGDVVFALSVGEVETDLNMVGAMADQAMREAVKRAITFADGFGILPSGREISEGIWKKNI
jgi:L-aminopeptidase/D-esterase-like protein